ncbi:MAG TPA: 6-phosphogluconolactonase [bacterium]|nr:6-phosphogluconolactonase [bacterium]
MADLRVGQDDEDLARLAADHFIGQGREALAKRGRFNAALSGGRGPLGLFRALAGRPGDLDWSKVTLYWVDERYVPFKDPDSNFGAACRLWLDALSAGPTLRPMFKEGMDAETASRDYAALLRSELGPGTPVLDLCLLGMGPDGHTASLFPGQPSLSESSRLCLAVRHPSSGQERLTLTYPVLNASRNVAFIANGAEKAALLAQVLAGAADVPAARVRPAQAPVWFVDRAAASKIQAVDA